MEIKNPLCFNFIFSSEPSDRIQRSNFQEPLRKIASSFHGASYFFIRSRCSGEDPGKIMNYAAAQAERLKPYLDPATIVTEPAPCPIERIKGRCRYMSMYRGGKLTALKQMFRYEAGRRPPSGIDFHVDVDPVSML